MIRSAKFTNLRKHKNAEFHFGLGLGVVRGPNEGGKSTIAEGIAYAFFGASALRNGLADAVTWGEKESTLKVEVNYQSAGVDFTFVRSKSGAEVIMDGKVHVTGQREVSGFAATLLGTDEKMATRLMLAGQGNLRGTLEQGPKATAEMLEELSGFDLFDILIEKMQDQLSLGSSSSVEARIAHADQQIAALANIEQPDVDAAKSTISAKAQEISDARSWITDIGEPAARKANTLHDTAAQRQRMHESAKLSLTKAEGQLALHTEQRDGALLKAADRPDLTRLPALKEELTDAAAAEARRAAYRAFKLLVNDGDEWDGGTDTLEAEIAVTQEKINVASLAMATAKGEIATAEAKIVSSSSCGFCDQDVSQFPDAVRKNSEAKVLIKTNQESIKRFLAEIAENGEMLDALRAVVEAAKPFNAFLLKNDALVTTDNHYVPPRLTWKGAAPSEVALDVASIRASIAAIEQKAKLADEASARAVALGESVAADEEAIGAAKSFLIENPPVDGLEDMKKAAQDRANEVFIRTNEIRSHEAAIAVAKLEVESAEILYQSNRQRAKDAAATLAAAQAELVTLTYNNALLKKVRSARPIISDKLWNTVLAAVSTMFSKMRGEKSVVTKGKDGFMVNGNLFTSLSGSALDLLGLAIRIALVKTFIPESPFLILDEPAAACSNERTVDMLGFIASAGFDQTILISHDEISETFADDLIEV